MPENFTENVNILDENDNVTVQLSATSAFVTTGGHGKDGSLLLFDDAATLRVRARAETGTLSLNNPAGEQVANMSANAGGHGSISLSNSAGTPTVRLFGENGRVFIDTTAGDVSIKLDGNGADSIVVRDNSSNIVLYFDRQTASLRVGSSGNAGELRVLDTSGQQVFDFTASGATLIIGATGNEGDLIVRDQNNKQRIKLDGGEGDIWVRNAAGDNLLLFDSTFAALYVGGQDNEGDVVVRDQNNKERIKLDGGEGDIWVRNAAGNNLLLFDSAFAALYVGGQDNEGDVIVRNGNGAETIRLDGGSGDIVLSNADCAEEFDLAPAADAEPGTVMVLDDNGDLQGSCEPYDKRVAGVISGAGDYRAGIVLDRQESQCARGALALVGKTYCKADAQYGRIGVGDLLTTSPTPGHAMGVSDPGRAFGAVIGKALRPLESGVGLIPILIALQ